MIIGIPKEIKNHEYRVGLTPASVYELVTQGHEVLVETTAGQGIGESDQAYEAVGAQIVADAKTVFAAADMMVKVKEPLMEESRLLREGQLLFTYLHLAANLPLTQSLMDTGCTAIAYETVTDDQGLLPLLAPMSEVAGRLSVQAGAHSLEKAQGGAGVLLGGVAGVAPAKVVVIGGGVVGSQAVQMAVGMGADVTVMDKSPQQLRHFDSIYQGRVKTLFSNKGNLEQAVINADLVIGAVLIPGAAAPKLVTADMIKQMREGSVVVDVAIDQGGCFETSKATSHAEPTYIVDGVVHYCVSNMPGAVARTSTYALNNATLPYVLQLANKGVDEALVADPHLQAGLTIYNNHVVHQAVAESLGLDFTPVQALYQRTQQAVGNVRPFY